MTTLTKPTDAEKMEAKDSAFSKFLDLQTTKFMLSFIPEGREADAVKVILRSAFDAGYDCGGGACAADFLHTIMAASEKRR